MAECINDINPFQPTGFQIAIEKSRLGAFTFFSQQVMHPGAQTNPTPMQSPRVMQIPFPADTVQYGELNFMAILDENFTSYKQVYALMLSYVNENFVPGASRTAVDDPHHFDTVVTALTSSNNANVSIRYRDCVMVSIGDITFDATATDVPTIIFPVTISFSHFDFED